MDTPVNKCRISRYPWELKARTEIDIFTSLKWDIQCCRLLYDNSILLLLVCPVRTRNAGESTWTTKTTCNCRKKSNCPLERKSLQTNVIYQVTIETTTEIYLGLAKNLKEGTKHPIDTGNENMRQNFPNMFGTFKMQRNRFRLDGKFLRNVNTTATLA